MADRSKDDPRSESDATLTPQKHAVKTTIVGGQPPGNRRVLPPIPVGIEELLSMAAVSDEFAAALYRDRAAAVTASGVELTATEQQILQSVDDRSLERMVANIDGGVPDQNRRAFLRRSTAALLALATGSVLGASAACSDNKKSTESPAGPDPQPPDPAPESPPDATPASAPPPDAAPPDAVTGPIGGSGGQPVAPTRGIRPDRPRPTRGISPDRPRPLEPRPTKGIRPDRPKDMLSPFDDEDKE